ncbi:MAG: hypothetical protein NC033_04310 [Clostridiales bacterium]|nr:hypothetical protein [Clostridiales bacterium]
MADSRVAYGLAKKYGIDTSGMSPGEVWEALKEKGVTPENASKGAYDSRSDIQSLKRINDKSDNRRFNEWANNLVPRGQTDIPDGVSKVDFIQRELGVSSKIAQEYIYAIEAYADNIYTAIRAYQQGENIEDIEEIAKISDNLEEYIRKAPRCNGGETYRGVGLSDEDLAKFMVGSTHDMKGVSSWSSEPTIANEFADHYKEQGYGVIFHSKTQSKGTAIRHLVNQDVYGENEVIVSKESKYRVLKRETDGIGRIHVYLEEI